MFSEINRSIIKSKENVNNFCLLSFHSRDSQLMMLLQAHTSVSKEEDIHAFLISARGAHDQSYRQLIVPFFAL